MKIKFYPFIVIVWGLISLSACAASSNGNDGDTVSYFAKLGYYLPKNIVEVRGSITKTTTFVPYKLLNDGSATWEVHQCSEKVASRDLKVQQILLPDTQHFYPFDLKSDFFTDVETNLTISETGLLTSIGVNSKGKAGNAMSAIGSFIGKILPFLGGGMLAETNNEKFETTENSLTEETLTGFCENPDIRIQAIDTWFKEELPDGYSAVTAAIAELKNKISSLEKEKSDFYSTHATGTSEDAMIAAEKKYSLLSSLITELETKKKTLETVKNSFKDKFIKEQKLAPIERIVKIHQRFDIPEIPPFSGKFDGLSKSLTPNYVSDALDDFIKMQEFYSNTGALIALDRNKLAPELLTEDKLKKYIIDSKKGTTLYARNAESAEVFLLQINSFRKNHDGDEDEYLSMVNVEKINVVASDSSVISIPLKTSAWAERRLNLEFHANGALKTVSAYKQATADQIFSGLNAGVTGVLDGYKSTLNSVTEIKTAQLGLDTFDEQAQLDALKRKKELIDAQISLEGASASAELANDKAVIDAQLAYLTSQSGLAAKELELLQNQQKLSQFGQPAGELATLSAQLELLQLQAQIDALNSSPAVPSQLQVLQEKLALLETRLSILLTTKALHEEKRN